MHILMIVTSHGDLGNSGHNTGIWLDEFTTPYYAFIDAGVKVTIGSPRGGRPPVEPRSQHEDAETDSTRRFIEDSVAQSAFASSLLLQNLKSADFDAVFFPGGHGLLWDLVSDPNAIALLQAFFSQDKPIGAVGHGPAAFLKVNTLNGPLVKDKQITAVSNAEEAAEELSDVVPFLLEDALKKNGALYSKAATPFIPHVVSDGLLVTGQNAQSSAGAAQALLALIKQPQ